MSSLQDYANLFERLDLSELSVEEEGLKLTLKRDLPKEKNDKNFKSITAPMAVYNMYLEKNKELIDLMNNLDILIKNVIKKNNI